MAKLVGFVAAGFAIGLAAFGGLASLWDAPDVASVLGMPAILIQTAGGGAVIAVGLLLGMGSPHSLRLAGVSVHGPGRDLMAAQVILTAARLIGAATALWVLLPPTPMSFRTFTSLFAAATAVGSISHVPAAAGVFEVVVLWALRGKAPAESVAAALIAYRAIYYVLPLMLSALAFACFESSIALAPGRYRGDLRLAHAAGRLAPPFMGVLAFATGAMLVVSGATPTFGQRLSVLSQHVPLWALETSSFLGSVVGVVFLFVARGLLDRRDGAWRMAIALGLASFVFALLKGLAFGEAAFLLFFSALLLATRQQFVRPTSMFDQPFTWGWFATVGAILSAAFGVLWLAFHGGESGLHGVWWQFEFDAQAPRALRAVLGASIVAVALALRQALKPPAGRALPPTALDLERARAVIENQPRGDAWLSFMGDKSLLFSASGRSFLMYGKRGRSWIALFDPVGERDEWQDLVNQFVAVCCDHGGRASFYQVRPENLPLYLDAGLAAMKLGEEAVIELPSFTLEGGARKHLRYALKRGERDGLVFELLDAEQAAHRSDDLAEISANWMATRRGEEKGFSVAAFDPQYMSGQRVGLVSECGAPIAFASVMATGLRQEATLGLMRCAGAKSPIAMEFLITRLVLDLRELGLARFSLGVAPLAGVRAARQSSRWHRLAPLIWTHGNRFYNFEGLRTFKNKFNPRWEPRYFVSSGALGPFVALADAAALIGARGNQQKGAIDA